MDSVKLPKGLISYTSEKELRNEKVNHWTPKTLGYAAVLLAVAVWFAFSMANRSTLVVDVQQERQPLYVQLSDGRIQNKYEIKVTNKQGQAASYAIDVLGLPQAEVQISPNPLQVGAGRALGTTVYIKVPPASLKESKTHFNFRIKQQGSGESARYETDFYAPEEMVGGDDDDEG